MIRVLSEITEESLAEANELLEFLKSESNDNWDAVMRETLNDQEYERGQSTVQSTLDRLGLDAPYGAIAGGTGMAKQHAGLEGEDSQRAVQILKGTDRLIQFGKGRGKCLMVVRPEPVTMKELGVQAKADKKADKAPRPARQREEGEREVPTMGDMAAGDVVGALKMVRDAWRQIEAERDELRTQVRSLERQVDNLNFDLDAAQSRVRTLEAELEQAHVSSWS